MDEIFSDHDNGLQHQHLQRGCTEYDVEGGFLPGEGESDETKRTNERTGLLA
jgi:hypothetical protein